MTQQKGETMPKGEGPAHNVNPQTDRCIRCGRNAFNRKNHPICMTADYIEKCQQFEPLLIDLTHTRSCDALIPGNEESCTCALRWRIRLRTEMEMHNAWRKRAEEAELALQSSQPTASEERTQVTDYLLEALPKFLGTTMDADDMREMAKIISDVEALQSVPSSPLLGPSVTEREIEGWANASDAGQPGDLTETVLFDAALKFVCERMQWSVETPSAYIFGWAKAIAEFAGKHKRTNENSNT